MNSTFMFVLLALVLCGVVATEAMPFVHAITDTLSVAAHATHGASH